MASGVTALLQKNLEQVLRAAGFMPQLNVYVKGYRIDVYLNVGNRRIAFDCMQHEESKLAVRNLIHQWESKNRELGFDKVVLVFVECNVSQRDYDLAKRYGIVVWDEKKMLKLLDAIIEKKKNMVV